MGQLGRSRVPLTRDSEGRIVCGALTRDCICGHRRPFHLKDEHSSYARCGMEGCECLQFQGRPCMAVTGLMKNGRCRFHGGHTPIGIQSPNFKDGSRSRHLPLPETLARTFEEAWHDPELLSLRRQIALHEAREHELSEQLSDGPEIVVSVKKTWANLRAVRNSDDEDEVAAAWKAHDMALSAQGMNGQLWQELRREAQLITKLKAAENERLDRLHQRLSREQAVAFIRAMSVSVKDAVTEIVQDAAIRSSVLREVSTRFAQLTQGGSSQNPDTQGGFAEGEVVDSQTTDE